MSPLLAQTMMVLSVEPDANASSRGAAGSVSDRHHLMQFTRCVCPRSTSRTCPGPPSSGCWEDDLGQERSGLSSLSAHPTRCSHSPEG